MEEERLEEVRERLLDGGIADAKLFNTPSYYTAII